MSQSTKVNNMLPKNLSDYEQKISKSAKIDFEEVDKLQNIFAEYLNIVTFKTHQDLLRDNNDSESNLVVMHALSDTIARFCSLLPVQQQNEALTFIYKRIETILAEQNQINLGLGSGLIGHA